MVAEARRNQTTPHAPPAWELGTPPAWLYVSKRLDLVAFTNDASGLWCSPVLTLGIATYYRIAPQVLHWLDTAGRALEAKYAAGAITIDQVTAYLAAMGVVYAFAAANLDPGACERAKELPPVLPAC